MACEYGRLMTEHPVGHLSYLCRIADEYDNEW